jgi:hypothetical protein
MGPSLTLGSEITFDARHFEPMCADKIAVNRQNRDSVAVFPDEFGRRVDVDNAYLFGPLAEQRGKLEHELLAERASRA